MTVLGSGAEAVIIHEGKEVLKKRIAKEYRIAALDSRLRESRTRREAKILARLKREGFPSPACTRCEGCDLWMEFVEGRRLRDCFQEDPVCIAEDVGRQIARMHSLGVVHGDLTTSNMILTDACAGIKTAKRVWFIDFGLSLFSVKDEDRACDLHVLRQVLESTHHDLFPLAWNEVLNSYRQGWQGAEDVLARLATVEKRGRNKAAGETSIR